MENRSKFDDFLSSLETDQLKDGQDALLLTGEIENQYGGSNGKCTNSASICSGSINDRRCTNKNLAGCEGSLNEGRCSITEIKPPTTPPLG